jgi:ELWxxDGT repeat protein
MRSLIALLLCLGLPAAEAQPAFQVADINTTRPDAQDPLLVDEDFAVLGSHLFFLADDTLHGVELWKTDGTTAGTVLVEDLCPGACSGKVRDLTVSNGDLYFIGFGPGLWKSDGTAAGTVRIADLPIDRLLGVSGDLYFTAWDPAHGWELWTSDGTAAGTRLAVDILAGPESSNPQLWLAVNGEILLAADDAVHGREPWLSDGTAAGTRMIEDVQPGEESSVWDPEPAEALLLADGTFLLVADDGLHGPELWRSNGTASGTSLVVDLRTGPEGSHPYGLTPLGSSVFFAAWDWTSGQELWKTDGTAAGTVIVKDMNPGVVSSTPREIRAFAGALYFQAWNDAQGAELWKSDGTAAGTAVVKDVNPGSANAFPAVYPNLLGEAGGSLFFFANEGTAGTRLWKTNGTAAGTVLVKSILPGASFGALGSHLYFHAAGPDGLELWKSDGTVAGTVQVKDIATLTSSVRVVDGTLAGATAALGNDLLFSADDGFGFLLWRTNGQLAGTLGVADLGGMLQETALLGPHLLVSTPGGLFRTDGTGAGTALLSGPQTAKGLTPAPGAVFFSGYDPNNDYRLWKTDGTPAGTVRLDGPYPEGMTPLGSAVLFSAEEADHGRELWTSNGTAAGTVLLKDLLPGTGSSSPSRLTPVGGKALFFATDESGEGLFRTDGTLGGTVLVQSIVPGGSAPAAVATTLFFVGGDGAHGFELWKSDGTAAGTVLVKDVLSGAGSSRIDSLTRVRDRVFFAADDGVHGRELWVSDGTEPGTRMVEDAAPGAGSSFPRSLKAVGHKLLFSAFDEAQGVEAWTSDGTEAGTAPLDDIAQGALPASPSGFTPAGPRVYFAANDSTAGFETWVFPRSVLGSTFADVPPGHWAWLAVESLVDAGITRGCAAGSFCPGAVLTRAEVAVFLGRATRFEGYTPPPATGTRFNDVPASHWAAAWIEQIATDGITQGCSAAPPLFCPGAQLTRAEMAVFLLRAKHGSSYFPPPATGTRFEDIPAGYWAAAWIEQLAAEGISLGCTATRFCPANLVTRAEMAVFLDRTF